MGLVLGSPDPDADEPSQLTANERQLAGHIAVDDKELLTRIRNAASAPAQPAASDEVHIASAPTLDSTEEAHAETLENSAGPSAPHFSAMEVSSNASYGQASAPPALELEHDV